MKMKEKIETLPLLVVAGRLIDIYGEDEDKIEALYERRAEVTLRGKLLKYMEGKK